MKPLNIPRFLFAIILLLMLFAMLMGVTSCKTTRHIDKGKSTLDSSIVKSIIDSNNLLKKENDLLKKSIAQKEKSEIVFEDKVCPPCPTLPIIPEDLDLLNKDSVNRLISDLNDLIVFQNNYINNQDNTIKKYADGTIEYKGRIKSYSLANDMLQEELRNKEALLQSGSSSKTNETKEVSATTTTLKKDTKTSVLDFWQWILAVFVGGAVCGYWFRSKYKIFG